VTLLNALLAFGALAFTIPLAIHLLHRSRFRTVDWGAMYLLESVIRINRRRMQLSNLLLLLLRCAIPVLLAFCLARPVLTGFQSLPGDAPESLVLVIDDSRSMSAGQAGEPTRMETAKNDLVSLLKTMSRRDEVILVLASSHDAPPATMGVSDAVDRIRDLRATAGPVDVGRLVEAAAEAVSQASHQQRRVLIVSDFQAHMFGSGAIESLDRLSESLAAQTPKPIVGFWNFAADSEALSNLSVDAIDVDSPAVVAGRSTQYSALIRNAGDDAVNDLRVIWSVNGVPLEPRIASIDARSSTTSRLNHKLDQAGVYEIGVSVEHGDCLIADNRRSIAINAMREINVLLVDGQPSNRPLEGETDFLAIALSPFAFGGDDQPDAVRTNTIRVSRVPAELAKLAPEVVVLANVRLTEETKKTLAKFVIDGGALVVFDGDEVKPEDYNAAWPSDDGTITLPATLGGIIGDPADQDAEILRIGELNPQFTPWNLLAPGDERPLGEVDVRAHRALTLADTPSNEKEATPAAAAASIVLLRMIGGDPLVVSAARGRGQIVQFAIPCDAAWSSLPLRMVYLPMMQQLVLDLAGKGKAERIDVGQPITVPLREFDVMASSGDPGLANQAAEVSFTVELPNGDEVAVRPSEDGSSRLAWADTRRPGTYRFRRSTAPEAEEAEPVIASTLRVVDVPEVESQLRDVPAERLSAAAEKLEAGVYTNLADIRGDDQIRRYGREVWRWLLLALLAFLILEMFVQQRLVRSTIAVGASS
jgi:hypothetical protein